MSRDAGRWFECTGVVRSMWWHPRRREPIDSWSDKNVQRTCQGWGTSGDVHYEKDYSRVICQRIWGMEPLVSFIRLRFEKSSCSLLQ